MPREKASYWDNMERINSAFPDKEMIKPHEIAASWVDSPKSVRKVFPKISSLGVSKAVLARVMSDDGGYRG